LSKKPGWNVVRALKFLNENYGKKSTAGKFCRWLVESKNGRGANYNTVLDEAKK